MIDFDMDAEHAVLAFFPHISAHFVSAEVRHFPAHEYETAKNWILEKIES